MSLLLWISVLSEGLVIVGLLKQKFKSNFGRMGTTKAALYIDYESVLWGDVNNNYTFVQTKSQNSRYELKILS